MSVVYVTGRRFRNLPFESPIPICRSNIGRYNVGLPFNIQMVGEANAPTTFEHVAVDEIAVNIEPLLHSSNWLNVIFSQVLSKEMDPLVTVIDVLLSRDDEQTADVTGILVHWVIRQTWGDQRLPAHLFQKSWCLAVVREAVMEHGIDDSYSVVHYIFTLSFQSQSHQIQMGGARCDGSIGTQLRGVGGLFSSRESLFKVSDLRFRGFYLIPSGIRTLFCRVGGFAIFNQGIVRDLRLFLDSRPLLPCENAVEDSNDEQPKKKSGSNRRLHCRRDYVLRELLARHEEHGAHRGSPIAQLQSPEGGPMALVAEAYLFGPLRWWLPDVSLAADCVMLRFRFLRRL